MEGLLKQRYDKLLAATNHARDKISAVDTGVTKRELTAAQITLKNNLLGFKEEYRDYKNKSDESQTFHNLQSTILDAEDALTEIEIILTINKVDTEPQLQARLPKLDLGKFDGDPLHWTSFWDRFEATVDNRNISDVEKLSYLLASLGGVAHEAVDGIGPTNINYAVAVEILKNRFGKRQTIIDAHNQALQTIPRAQSTASDCRKTLNNIEKHLRVLEALGESVDASHLRVTLFSKFPEQVLYQTNLLTVDDTSIQSIRKALEKVISAMERSGSTKNLITLRQAAPEKEVSTVESLHVKTEKQSRKRKWQFGKTEHNKNNAQSAKRPRITCGFCNKPNHYSEDCRTYNNFKDRKLKLSKDKKCYLCFRVGHTASACKARIICFHCKGKHNRALCLKNAKKGNNSSNTDNKNETHLQTLTINSYNFLQTAVTKVKNVNRTLNSRVLLDSGSQRSYMTTRLAKELNIVPDREDLLTVYTFGCSKPKEISSPSVEISLLTKRSVEKVIRVNIVPHITNRVPVVNINNPQIIDIVADDDSMGDSIDLLIGNDFYFSFIRTDRIKMKEHAYLIDTDFGWILSGHVKWENELNTLTVSTYCQCYDSDCPYFAKPDLPLRNIDIKFLWTLESIGIVDSPKATREEDVVKFFNKTTVYNNGRYEVKWPWIEFPPELPTNFGLAFGRLKSLLKRSSKETIEEYNDILREQLQACVIEVVDPALFQDHVIHYLPHHMVKQENKRGRLVYDASAKAKNQKSLNECLYSGPSMLEDLVGLLIKFRHGTVGVTADVEKAFLQVGLQEEDRDVTRFIWVKDPTKELSEDNLVHYRFRRVPFGVISSPFLLTATIRHHMSKKNEDLLKRLGDRCYVDNLVTAVDSTKIACQIYQEARSIFNDMSMNIRDWISNDNEFMGRIPKEHRAKQTDKIKILGLIWNLEKDTLQLNINNINTSKVELNATTKKDVLRTIARIYDPCGFVSPLLLPAKLLFQELCHRKVTWDSLIAEDLQQKWKSILEELETAKTVEIPRNVSVVSTEKKITYQLHCFTDASKQAYAAVCYLHVVTKDEIKTSFLMSKSRVTPVEDKEDLKIPRLELLAYLIGSRLLKYLKSHLEKEISKFYLWTDSQIVLAWMKSGKLLPPFVSRRVNEIKETQRALGGIELCYVNTKVNPADTATRTDVWQLKQDLWFNGPDFLTKDEMYWPKRQQIDDEKVLVAGEALDIIDGPEMTAKGYETLPDIEIDDMSEDRDIGDDLREIIKLQQEYYPDEVEGKETSLSRNLRLFLDIDGVLRSKGRLSNTNWIYDKRYPILLPKDCVYTNNVIKKVHEENYHVGVSHVLSILREKFWIPQGRAQVQKILRKCPQCVKYGGGPYTLPPTPALPTERVNYSTAFTFTGLDYLGPVYIKTEHGKEKRWICLMTCLAVRALHLELVKDLTAEECLLAIRRFTAARGVPKIIVSDNALQFKLTSEILTSSYCTENHIKWKFIPQLAPWHGGFYERLVALVKHCLKRTIDKHLLNEGQLQTIVKEIESVINTRPLTTVGSELEEVLRPVDFLSLGKCFEITPIIEESIVQGTSTKIDLIKGWKKGNTILNEYKIMFIGQYLPSLRERYSHAHKQPRIRSHRDPQLGDIVQIKDDSKGRVNWKVGKISALLKGIDGLCRVAKVKVGDYEFTRSIAQLYPLEADTSDDDVREAPTSVPDDNTPVAELPQSSLEVAPQVTPDTVVIDTPMEIGDPADIYFQEDDRHVESEAIPKAAETEELESLKTLQLPYHKDHVTEDADAPSESMTDQGIKLRERRTAAIRAKEKIAEWTRQLLTLL